MKIASSLIFALGVMIAISGGAKMPHVALTGAGFVGGLKDGKFDGTNVHDLRIGTQAAVFYDRSAEDTQGQRTAYKVRLPSDDGQEKANMVKLLKEKSISYQQAGSEDQLAVPVLPSTSVISSKAIICSLGNKLMMNSKVVVTLDLGSALESTEWEKPVSPSRANTQVFNKQDRLNMSSSLLPIRNSAFINGFRLLEYPADLFAKDSIPPHKN